jgi:hypothetical protein
MIYYQGDQDLSLVFTLSGNLKGGRFLASLRRYSINNLKLHFIIVSNFTSEVGSSVPYHLN